MEVLLSQQMRRNGDPKLVWEHLLSRPSRVRGNLVMQLVTSFIDAIDGNRIPRGVRLPSSRAMAESLEIGRNTVIEAVNVLIEQGYLLSRARSGVFVAGQEDRQLLATPEQDRHAALDWWNRLGTIQPSTSGQAAEPLSILKQDFKFGQFDLSLFPTSHWRECERSASGVLEIAEWGRDMFDRDDEHLVGSLRRHVLPTYGIWAAEDEILVTLGGQEGRYLVAQLLCKSGITVGIENPGMPDINDIVSATPARRVYLPLDELGASLSSELKQCDVAFLTPGHQCPTTAVMDDQRRRDLLRLAQRRDMIIVEDTYQTETIGRGRIIPALKSMDHDGRVLHIGSLSKSVAPGLRLGFVVAPPPVIRELRAIRRLIHRHPPGNTQRAIGMFIDRGYYHSYLRRIAVELSARNEAMTHAIERWLPEASFQHCQGASTFWINLPETTVARTIAAEARKWGLLVEAGDRFFFSQKKQNFLLLAVSRIQANQIDGGIRQIGSLVQAAVASP